jgi:hypothetical protein
MKKTLFALFCIVSLQVSAQTSTFKMPALDKSPMDMAYYPANFPVLKIQDKATEPLVARVIYSRPMKNGRTIFGELVEYNQVWRMGANEATEIEFFRDVKIGGKKILKGKYSIFAVPHADRWTVILNKDTDTWGAFKYDEKKDVARVDVPAEKIGEPIEAFSIQLDKAAAGFNVVIAWDQTKVSLPVSLK